VVSSLGRFIWYELTTTDVAAAAAFYTKVIGWGAQDVSAPGRPYVLFTAGKDLVSGAMELPEDARKTGATPCWVGYVGVDDVDAAADRVKRLGGTLYVPPMEIPDISRFAVFADPQSAALAMSKSLSRDQAQPADTNAPGRVCWNELFAADWEKAWAFYGAIFNWEKGDADVDATGTYQLFCAGGQAIGGMLTKPPTAPAPFWLYYFNVDDIDAAAKRVEAGGGRVLAGPLEMRGGSWVIQCTDPQGAIFALEGTRKNDGIGFFVRTAPRDPSDARSRRWSW
jgi:predicted enzyme related to lactoylglutathione lyase